VASLYVHVPFRKPPEASVASTFTDAVIREATHHAPRLRTSPGGWALYIGGGRPSGLPISCLRTLVTGLCEYAGDSGIEEITLELAPADATSSFLAFLRDLGVTRLSVNAQSGVDDQLQATRRIQEAGIHPLSVDLAFGGAASPLSEWKRTLHRAMHHRLPHVTLLERDPAQSHDDEDERAECFAFAMRFLRTKGYEQYELTHFARPGHRSAYQVDIYAHNNVVGLGPGAESFWWADRTDPTTARRWSNVPDVATYVERLRDDSSPVAQREDLSPTALAQEYILLRLRTGDGLNLNTLNDRYDFSLRDRRASTLDRLANEGLIDAASTRIRLTPQGRLLADAVTRRLIRDT